jgi:signal peptidase I
MTSKEKAVEATGARSRAGRLRGGKPAVSARAPRARSKAREYTEAIAMAVVMALFFRQFAVQAFRIPSSSMEDTLLIGDFLFVNKFVYGAQVPFTDLRLPAVRSPERGDIIVFRSPTDGRDFIKRCVAVGGDMVEIREKRLYINGEEQIEPHALHKAPQLLGRQYGTRDFMPPRLIPEGHIFMMGDNRDNSSDSRFWGPLPIERVKGKAMFIYFSVDTSRGWYRPVPRLSRFFDIIR